MIESLLVILILVTLFCAWWITNTINMSGFGIWWKLDEIKILLIDINNEIHEDEKK